MTRVLNRLLRGIGVAIVSSVLCAAGIAAPAFTEAKPDSVGFSAARLAALDSYLRNLVDTGQVPGATTLLARHGKVVAFNVYGKADVPRNIPVTRDTIFRVYSQTKVVTGVAMMMLFEAGKWHFDDPITKFIPEFKQLRVFKKLDATGAMQVEDIERPPTMRELLTHSAGFGYGLDTSTPVERAYRQANFMHAANPDQAIARIAAVPMAAQPGQRWHYSAAADIQGYIVERISGQSLAEFMQRRIFGPLKMKDTAFYVPADKQQRFVTLLAYDDKLQALAAPSPDEPLLFDYSKPPGVASGGAGLVSTTLDFARFAQMLLNGGELDGVRLLSPLTVKLLASNHLSDAVRNKPDALFGASTGWGFGVDVAVTMDQAKGGTLRGAGSYDWSGAAGTWFWVDPANDLIFVGMIQVMDRWTHPTLVNIDKDAATFVYGALVAPQK